MPDRLTRVEVFESLARYTEENGGRKVLKTDLSLSAKIDKWVDETSALIISVGPVTVTETSGKSTIEVRSTIAVVYVPSKENTDGGQGRRAVADSADIAAGADAGGVDDKTVGFGASRFDELGLPILD